MGSPCAALCSLENDRYLEVDPQGSISILENLKVVHTMQIPCPGLTCIASG